MKQIEKTITNMGLLDLLFGSSNQTTEDDSDDKEKGIFQGGDKLTMEDMIIMDILDEDDYY